MGRGIEVRAAKAEGLPDEATDKGQKRKRAVSIDELINLRAEEAVAVSMGIKWQHRGPKGPTAQGAPPNAPTEWRGQKWRSGSGGGEERWGNAGGSRNWWFQMEAKAKRRAKREGAWVLEAFYRSTPKPAKKG